MNPKDFPCSSGGATVVWNDNPDFPCSKCGKYACYEFHHPTHVRYCEDCFDSVRKNGLAGNILTYARTALNSDDLTVRSNNRHALRDARELAELVLKESKCGGVVECRCGGVSSGKFKELKDYLNHLPCPSISPQTATSAQDVVQEVKAPTCDCPCNWGYHSAGCATWDTVQNVGGYWHTAYKNVGLELDTLREKLRELGDRGLVREPVSPQAASAQDAVQEIQTFRESVPPQVAVQEIQTPSEVAPLQVAQAARVAAVSFIEREDGRLLCVWNRRYGGWVLPGGKVEEGETVDAGQERELREETSLETLTRKQIYYGPVKSSKSGKPRLNADEAELKRASFVYIFRVTTEGTPREVEFGCPITWLTREEFLQWSPFRDLYVEVFKSLAGFIDAARSSEPTRGKHQTREEHRADVIAYWRLYLDKLDKETASSRQTVQELSLQRIDKEKRWKLLNFAMKASIGDWRLTWIRNKDDSWNLSRFDKETRQKVAFSSDDMAYIAASQPQVILALLRRIDELEVEAHNHDRRMLEVNYERARAKCDCGFYPDCRPTCQR